MKQGGFTLVEMLVVVAIIAILAVIAIPSYQEYVIRTNRADMQTEMMRIAQDLQRYQVANKNFKDVTLAKVGSSGNYPQQGTALYTLNLTISSVPKNSNRYNRWELTATPINDQRQKGNGIICLNSDGHKFWSKGQTTCTLSANSDWVTP